MRANSIKMGFWMLGTFIAFFLFVYAMGLILSTELRLFNVVIQLFFIYYVIKLHYKLYPTEVGNYLAGVARGMETSVVGVGGFAVFTGFFLYANPTLMDNLSQNSQMGAYLNPFTISLYIVAEGLMVSLIGSYVITRVLDIIITKQEV